MYNYFLHWDEHSESMQSIDRYDPIYSTVIGIFNFIFLDYWLDVTLLEIE